MKPRLWVGALLLLLAAGCAPTRSSAAISASQVGQPGADPDVVSWCGELTVQATAAGGRTEVFQPGQLARISVKVGQVFKLTATSSCGMAFLVDASQPADDS